MCVHNVFWDKFAELCVYLSFLLSCFCMWRCEKKHVEKHLSLIEKQKNKKVPDAQITFYRILSCHRDCDPRAACHCGRSRVCCGNPWRSGPAHHTRSTRASRSRRERRRRRVHRARSGRRSGRGRRSGVCRRGGPCLWRTRRPWASPTCPCHSLPSARPLQTQEENTGHEDLFFFCEPVEPLFGMFFKLPDTFFFVWVEIALSI